MRCWKFVAFKGYVSVSAQFHGAVLHHSVKESGSARFPSASLLYLQPGRKRWDCAHVLVARRCPKLVGDSQNLRTVPRSAEVSRQKQPARHANTPHGKVARASHPYVFEVIGRHGLLSLLLAVRVYALLHTCLHGLNCQRRSRPALIRQRQLWHVEITSPRNSNRQNTATMRY